MLSLAGSRFGLKRLGGDFGETVTTGMQRKRTALEIQTDLLRAEAAYRHAAPISYGMTAARLLAVKDINAVVFEGAAVNAQLVRSLHAGLFLPGLAQNGPVRRTGNAHLAVAITPSVLRTGACYFNIVNFVNRLEEYSRGARPVRSRPSSQA